MSSINTTPPTNIITMMFHLPPYGIDSMNRPNPTCGQPSERLGGDLYKSIK
jgi:hypothetical protein